MNIKESNLNWASALTQRQKTDLIVLHHAAAKNATIYNIHNWHLAQHWAGCGYHFYIRKDGTIYRGRPECTIGAHAVGHNATSIGICLEGDFNKQSPTKEQIKSGAELITYLKKKYNIENVKGHGDLMATDCPGKWFVIEQFLGEKENLVLSFQKAVTADGIKLKVFGCDGKYGTETALAMKQCIIKKRLVHKYKNATKLVQRLLGVTQDGKCGKETESAIMEFQKKNGLVVDGCCGEKTWRKLLGV